jgi:DNA polymerase III delta prime subunit
VLAELAPEQQRTRYDVSGSGPTQMVWIGASRDPGYEPVQLDPSALQRVGFAFGGGTAARSQDADTYRAVDLRSTKELERLSRYDAMTPGVPSLAYGCMWAVGTAQVEGEERRLIRPLVSAEAHLRSSLTGTRLLFRNQWNLWPLLVDDADVAELEQNPMPSLFSLGSNATDSWLLKFPNLLGWANRVLAASNLPAVRQVLAPTDPTAVADGPLRIIAGWGLFTEGSADLLRPRETLRAWSADPSTAGSAFASLYLGSSSAGALSAHGADGAPPPPEVLGSSVPLTHAQEQAVRRAHHEPIVAISGPPGTGKSQTAVAIASDAVARGESVLVATQSAMAADVLAELLDRVPGPTPVLFGGGQRAGELAAKLADGVSAPADHRALPHWQAQQRQHHDLAAAVGSDLLDVDAVERWSTLQLTADAHRARAPRLFDASLSSLEALMVDARRLVAGARFDGPGWLASRRRRRALAQLRKLVGATSDATLDHLHAAVDVAEARLRASRAHDRDLHVADRRWIALVEAEEAARHALGHRIAAEVSHRADAASRRNVAALATALRAGRARRRAHLSQVDVPALTRALPLWIGTLGDIEALLPSVAGEFDLVILDEASMIDQASACAALLRAKRAVIIGDPRQLRFVSFLADAAVQAAIDAHGCRPIADRLDLRRTSAFDLAAGVSPVTFLDEHFRSVPHLIGFSAQRFYGGRLQLATRHPANEGTAAIEVVQVGGERADGVNDAEVAAAVEQVQRLLAEHPGPVGVISPHRPQVDALRTAIADAVGPDVWGTGRLRVATVHGFQGSECDAVVASFGISGDGGRSRRFLEDPNLFNVLITRARHRMVLLASVDEVPPGLLDDYLRWARQPPALVADLGPADEWTAQLATLVADQGLTVRLGYPVGTWTIDLVAHDPTDPARALAISTRVHPDGPHRHIQRHLALHRAGWRQAEAFPTSDAGAAALLAIDLATRTRTP